MIARREGDYAARALLRRQLEQAVGSPPELERPAGLEALALEPHARALDIAFEQRRPLNEIANSGRGVDDVLVRDLGMFS